jgi:hypothetical protein
MPVTSKKNTRKLDKTAGDMPVTSGKPFSFVSSRVYGWVYGEKLYLKLLEKSKASVHSGGHIAIVEGL